MSQQRVGQRQEKDLPTVSISGPVHGPQISPPSFWRYFHIRSRSCQVLLTFRTFGWISPTSKSHLLRLHSLAANSTKACQCRPPSPWCSSQARQSRKEE